MPLSEGVAPAAEPCGHNHGLACSHQHGHGRTSEEVDPTALISARGICISRNGRDLLLDVDLDIHEREIVTLIGLNGAGKTTLVRVLLGLEKPDRGTVHRRKDLRIGYVPQRFDSDAVIPMTVERFLMLGSSADAHSIAEVLAHVDAESVRHQQLGELSGGELQRVLLAREASFQPRVKFVEVSGLCRNCAPKKE